MINAVSLKKDFIQALISGNIEKAVRLRNLIKIGEGKELPFFIQYREENGRIITSWNSQSFTPQEFDNLKSDLSQTVFWEEIKSYEN